MRVCNIKNAKENKHGAKANACICAEQKQTHVFVRSESKHMYLCSALFLVMFGIKAGPSLDDEHAQEMTTMRVSVCMCMRVWPVCVSSYVYVFVKTLAHLPLFYRGSW
jgi:hypothetical protein